ncbi:MAG: hypothetical protein Q8922_10095 [Bacteroidota bacterium]|nr:hypothetical protein [Bacteroidota bacterium]MDP4232404.1 hypothetical protein [Bacteroidota bacterium]MDP4241541.1 hypothetical protein [Bacteroidota bacterium]MDP4288275.1 hypothetical protein [Bacteroidota bacterium]
MPTPNNPIFAIEIDFEKGSENPSRVFRALTGLIEAFEQIDRALLSSIDPNIQPVAIIEDVETGSVRAWLAYALRSVDDSALKDGDWKKVVGSYLVKGKYVILNYIENKTSITSRAELEVLENDLLRLAEETDILNMPSYSRINPRRLLPGIQSVTTAMSNLSPQDTVTYKSDRPDLVVNAEFTMIPENLEELLTRQSLGETHEAILKVKKPDYLGSSQWEFRHGTHTIAAKIADEIWLTAFQNRAHDVRPGDSLRVSLRTVVNYGYDFEVVAESYTILQVFEVLPMQEFREGSLF